MLEKWIKFLTTLKANNRLDWFHAHKNEYLEVKIEFEELIKELLVEMVKIDPDLGILSLKDCTYRINRDIRFTKDKSPYKTWLAGSFATGGKIGQKPTYYFHIDSTGELIIGGGLYNPSSQQIVSFRKALTEKPQNILKILNNSEFVQNFQGLSGEKLVKIPTGFTKETKNPELLKHKNIIAMCNLPLKNISKELKVVILARFKVLKPLTAYLRKTL